MAGRTFVKRVLENVEGAKSRTLTRELSSPAGCKSILPLRTGGVCSGYDLQEKDSSLNINTNVGIPSSRVPESRRSSDKIFKAQKHETVYITPKFMIRSKNDVPKTTLHWSSNRGVEMRESTLPPLPEDVDTSASDTCLGRRVSITTRMRESVISNDNCGPYVPPRFFTTTMQNASSNEDLANLVSLENPTPPSLQDWAVRRKNQIAENDEETHLKPEPAQQAGKPVTVPKKPHSSPTLHNREETKKSVASEKKTHKTRSDLETNKTAGIYNREHQWRPEKYDAVLNTKSNQNRATNANSRQIKSSNSANWRDDNQNKTEYKDKTLFQRHFTTYKAHPKVRASAHSLKPTRKMSERNLGKKTEGSNIFMRNKRDPYGWYQVEEPEDETKPDKPEKIDWTLIEPEIPNFLSTLNFPNPPRDEDTELYEEENEPAEENEQPPPSASNKRKSQSREEDHETKSSNTPKNWDLHAKSQHYCGGSSKKNHSEYQEGQYLPYFSHKKVNSSNPRNNNRAYSRQTLSDIENSDEFLNNEVQLEDIAEDDYECEENPDNDLFEFFPANGCIDSADKTVSIETYYDL